MRLSTLVTDLKAPDNRARASQSAVTAGEAQAQRGRHLARVSGSSGTDTNSQFLGLGPPATPAPGWAGLGAPREKSIAGRGCHQTPTPPCAPAQGPWT